VIVGFKHRGLKRLFERGDKSQVGADMLQKVENILAVLNRANRHDDVDLPGFRLHPLRGDLKGLWAVTVCANRRIVFRFDGANVTDVDLFDYH